MTLRDFIAQYRTEHNLSQRQLALQCALSNGYISILERGINPNTGRPLTPTLPVLQKLADGMGMSLSELISKADDLPLSLRKESLEHAPHPANRQTIPAGRAVPRLGRIACGGPLLAEQNIETYDTIPDHVPCDFTLVCKGDSMKNARIFDGDLVCIRQQPQVESGEIAAVMVGEEEATLKRVRVFEDLLILEPENPRYEPLIFRGEEMNTVRILGKATYFISAVR